MIRIQDLKAPVSIREEDWKALVAERLRIPAAQIHSLTLVRRSIDARDKQAIHLVLSFEAEVENEAALLRKRPGTVTEVHPKPLPPIPRSSFKTRPVIAGAGPAGLFAALILARQGASPIIIERGKPMDKRLEDVNALRQNGILNPESNVQFGEGGAGTFSDGKLTTGIKSPWNRFVLETFASHGAPGEILYDQKPHIGTDRLRGVIGSMRREIEQLGGEFLFSCRLTGVVLTKGSLTAVRLLRNGQEEELTADTLILCIGHSARDTIQLLFNQGIRMVQKPFAVGVRIEHPQEMINRSQYGGLWNHPALGAAPYKLSVRTPDQRGVYTFCMCPGGEVIAAATQSGGIVVNGMSEHARNGVNANAALLVGIRTEDFGDTHPLAGIPFQRSIESKAWQLGGGGFRAPAQRVEDFLAGRETAAFGDVRPTYLPGTTPADLNACFPSYIAADLKYGIRQMDSQLKGFAHPDAVLTGVETRSSSPVRLVRGEDGSAEGITGLFPAGEGAGYAGGIVSAAVDGIRAAIHVLEYSNL